VIVECVRQSLLRFDEILLELVEIAQEAQKAKLERSIDIRELPNVVDFMHVMLEAIAFHTTHLA
jgi:hypothetical protein